MHRIDWDDLRYVLAVAEQGSLAGAARALGVNHTTVLRRVNAFEAAQAVRLFERLPTGYALTAGGEELLAAARRVGDLVTALERRLAGQDLRLEGSLRATTTDTLMVSILPAVLAAFQAAQPGIQVEISLSNAVANLTKRDADVAIRPTGDPPETLVGRRVAGLAFALYAARGAGFPGEAPLDALPWVAPDDTLAESSLARWMRATLPGIVPMLRADSLVALREAAAAGLGVAALPCYLGDTDARLVRVRPDPLPLRLSLWVLTHADLRRTARIRAFAEFVADALARERDLFEGRRPLAKA
jgi:DNA-binding transcriptional LysR family regulator